MLMQVMMRYYSCTVFVNTYNIWFDPVEREIELNKPQKLSTAEPELLFTK